MTDTLLSFFGRFIKLKVYMLGLKRMLKALHSSVIIAISSAATDKAMLN